jgi:hypothetical protein
MKVAARNTLMRKAATTLLVGFIAAHALFGCDRGAGGNSKESPTSPAAATTFHDDVLKTMETYFEVGLKRPYSPGGPRFELPPSYYEFFASHLTDAAPFLESKFSSTRGAEMMNAYDIVAHMGRFPSSRTWALAHMKQAIDEGGPAKYMLQETYKNLTEQ